MRLTLKPYREYKSSGMPWLDKIPAHWRQRPLKHWVIINGRTLSEMADPEYTFKYFDIGSIATGYLVKQPERMKFKDSPSRARRVLSKGDTIVSTVRTYLKAVYFINHDEDDLIASTGFAVLTPGSEVNPEYLSYLIRSNPFIEQVTANSVGIAYPAITESVLGRFYVALPPVEEQKTLCIFLAHIDHRVNRIIREKRRMIALLNEQKQAIIQRAVTRGLDLSVRLKPSGMDWLGEVPEHWKIRRLKNIFRDIDRRSVNGTEVLLSLRMHRGLVPHEEVSEKPISSQALIGFKRVAPGQVVMNRMRAAIGMFAVAPRPGIVSPDYAVFESTEIINPHFYIYLFKTPALRSVFRLESKGLGTGSSGFLRLYTDRFGLIKVPMPAPTEQAVIVKYIQETTAGIETAIARTQREIELIGEYRNRLIADIVTGKLDPREVNFATVVEREEPPYEQLEDDVMEDGEELEMVEEGSNAND